LVSINSRLNGDAATHNQGIDEAPDPSVNNVVIVEPAAMLGEVATRVGIAYVGAVVVLTMLLMALN
jgi:hypothetical protein